MIRRYCDICKKSITDDNAEFYATRTIDGKSVDISINICGISGSVIDICTKCTIEIIKENDNP